ncbi:hypothetical protein [Streptomyces sp. NRRL F-4474]|uniref:hypothetical protein n=1 Tax=Streptomyces sp. NRRL F-4474 TaxID=1463851 RepID=UPI000ADE39A3|nr:hypothetical protein [Streptomyces sp. NRRL F-4474]
MSGSPSPSGAHDGEDHRAPRWVKVSAGIAVLLVVVFVVVHLAGGGMVGHAP